MSDCGHRRDHKGNQLNYECRTETLFQRRNCAGRKPFIVIGSGPGGYVPRAAIGQRV